MIFLLIILYLAIFFLEGPALIKEEDWKTFSVFLALLALGMALSIRAAFGSYELSKPLEALFAPLAELLFGHSPI
ncbi:MAG: hypothetical protein GX766_02505 [Firmicutes bacterium]|jgi:hypothetical protein|nr:hypothetical protein [Bacillota bacterium]HQD39867.1 hypothetical protein [Bacillota bacterium]